MIVAGVLLPSLESKSFVDWLVQSVFPGTLADVFMNESWVRGRS